MRSLSRRIERLEAQLTAGVQETVPLLVVEAATGRLIYELQFPLIRRSKLGPRWKNDDYTPATAEVGHGAAETDDESIGAKVLRHFGPPLTNAAIPDTRDQKR
jgi:hypothetical protein